MNERIWNNDFNVGCDYVDKAHKKLFSVLRKVESLLSEKDYEKNKFACVEAVKFLYDYTSTHFAEEEAFMLEIGYKGYSMHKALHDNLKNVTLPALDNELQENNYSQESVQQFIGVFAGWLSGHILIEDRAITGKALSKWNISHNINYTEKLDFEFKKVMQELSRTDVTLINKHYEGVPIEDAFYYEIEYKSTKIIFIAQNSIILKLTGDILGEDQTGITKAVLLTYVQLIQSFAKAVLLIVKPDEDFTIINNKSISSDVVISYFEDSFPSQSLQWKSSLGYTALCLIDMNK